MSDAMQVAQKRRQEYKNSIAEMEKEIAELQELIADLDSFIEFGDALLTNGSDAVDARPNPDAISAPVQKNSSAFQSVPSKKPSVSSVTPASSDTNEQISKALAQRANG